MATYANFMNGQRVRYIGKVQSLRGQIGVFAWLENHCIYSGILMDYKPGFVDREGTGWYAREDEMEPIDGLQS